MIDKILLIITTILIIYKFYKWATINENYFKKLDIKYLKPVFLLGNTGGFFLRTLGIDHYIMYLYNSFPNEKLFGLFTFRQPLICVRDPDILKQLTIKEFDHFVNHKTLLTENTDTLFGNSLFMLRDDKWRDMRATLSPAFTGTKMRQMFKLVTECAEQMSAYYLKETSADGVDGMNSVDMEMKEIFTRYTNDVIATCAFGIKVDSFNDKNNDFYKNGKRLANFADPMRLLRLIGLNLVPSIMKMLNIELIGSKDGKRFKSMVLNTIDIRENENILRPDMINIMMKIRKGNFTDHQNNFEAATATVDDDDINITNNFASVTESKVGKRKIKRNWTDDEIVAQCFLFFSAGYETTSTLLSFLSYELAIHAHIQQRLYEEILQTNEQFKSGGGGAEDHITYEIINEMEYMDMVISEALRKWPPAPLSDRLCSKEYQYDDGKLKFKIEKDTQIWIPIYGFHHDPKYYPKPEKFDPERFSVENKANINLNAYMPFGIGPRNCIGSRFALMEMKAIIYCLLLNFKLEPNEKTQIPIKLGNSPIGLVPKQGIYLSLKRRH